jgi:protocatechuate 3,4-dioxygenase beta subunit
MNSKTPIDTHGLNRRQLLSRIGIGLAAFPILHACTSDSSGLEGDAGTTGSAADAAAGSAADAAADAATGSTADAATGAAPDAATGSAADAAPAGGWAQGGTVAMTDVATYPDPFTAPLSTCALVAATTAGPCTTTSDLARVDVSEGWTGLPVRLAIKVVSSSCQPIAGAVVKIWHTNLAGVYSGQTPNPAMCSNNDQNAISMNFMRGVQTTSADGVVYFDTCFPGWYHGRAVHIHFQVKSGSTSYKISQLFFPEALTTEIFATHPEYVEFGQPDTLFSNDGVMAGIPAASRSRHVFEYARMTDGAMLASKVVSVTS